MDEVLTPDDAVLQAKAAIEALGPQPDIRWIGGRAVGETSFVVLYRWILAPYVSGFYFETGGFLSSVPQRPIGLQVIDEISESTREYLLQDSPWAAGLVVDPDQVRWGGLGDGAFPGQRRVRDNDPDKWPTEPATYKIWTPPPVTDPR